MKTFFRKHFARFRPTIKANSNFCEIDVIAAYSWGGPEDIYFYKKMKEDVLQWLIETFGIEGTTWWVNAEPHIIPDVSDVSGYTIVKSVKSLQFLNDEDLVLFKLTWIGK